MTSYISRVEEFKNSLRVKEYKQTFEDLQEDVTDLEAGDVCMVAEEFTLNGKKYDDDTLLVWTGSEFVVLGGPELTEEEMEEIGKRLVWMIYNYCTKETTFRGEVERFSDCFESVIVDTGFSAEDVEEMREYEPDFEVDELNKWTVLDNSGNVLLEGREEIEARTGYIDMHDCRYKVEELSKLDLEEYEAIVKDMNGFTHDEEILQYAKRKLEEYRQNG